MDKEQLNQLFLKLQKAGFFSDDRPVKVKVHVLGCTRGPEPKQIPASIEEWVKKITSEEGLDSLNVVFGKFKSQLQGAKIHEPINTSKHNHTDTTSITTLTDQEKEQVKQTVLNLASNGQITELSRVAEELCQAMITVKNFGATKHI